MKQHFDCVLSIAKHVYDCGSIVADLFTKYAKFDASGVACLRCWYRGNKEPAALEDGFREIELSWTVMLLDLKGRGLSIGPRLAAGDCALGFWNALAKVYGDTRRQWCWVHKTANGLIKLK